MVVMYWSDWSLGQRNQFYSIRVVCWLGSDLVTTVLCIQLCWGALVNVNVAPFISWVMPGMNVMVMKEIPLCKFLCMGVPVQNKFSKGLSHTSSLDFYQITYLFTLLSIVSCNYSSKSIARSSELSNRSGSCDSSEIINLFLQNGGITPRGGGGHSGKRGNSMHFKVAHSLLQFLMPG